MKYKRVLYTDRLTEQIRTKLGIVKYDKIKSKKNNVYFVYFNSEQDAEHAQKACKRLSNVSMKLVQSKSATSVTTSEEATSSTKTTTPTPTPPVPQMKIKLMSRHLPPNSLEIRELLGSIDACLNAMNIVQRTFEEISHLDQHKYKENRLLFHRLYTEHSTALYLKMALTSQLKTMFATNIRISWSTVASQVNTIERHVYHEQTFLKHIQSKQTDLLRTIHFQSSITMSSKLAYELVKLTET